MNSNFLEKLDELERNMDTKRIKYWFRNNYCKFTLEQKVYLESLDWFISCLKYELGIFEY